MKVRRGLESRFGPIIPIRFITNGASLLSTEWLHWENSGCDEARYLSSLWLRSCSAQNLIYQNLIYIRFLSEACEFWIQFKYDSTQSAQELLSNTCRALQLVLPSELFFGAGNVDFRPTIPRTWRHRPLKIKRQNSVRRWSILTTCRSPRYWKQKLTFQNLSTGDYCEEAELRLATVTFDKILIEYTWLRAKVNRTSFWVQQCLYRDYDCIYYFVLRIDIRNSAVLLYVHLLLCCDADFLICIGYIGIGHRRGIVETVLAL